MRRSRADDDQRETFEVASVKPSDAWAPLTQVDSGNLMPGAGHPHVHNEEEQTVRADTDDLVPKRVGTLDEPTMDRQGESLQAMARPVVENPITGKLVVIAGNDNGREFELSGRPITVGRALGNDIVLTDIAVSRKHMSIEFDGRQYILADHGSGNGTMINDRLETGRCNLRHGDRLELGNTTFRFDHPATRAAAREDEFADALPTAVARTGSKQKIQPIDPAAPPRPLGAARRRKPITLPPPTPGQEIPVLRVRGATNLPLPGAPVEEPEPAPVRVSLAGLGAPIAPPPELPRAELPRTELPRANSNDYGLRAGEGRRDPQLPGPYGAMPGDPFAMHAVMPGQDLLDYSIKPKSRGLVIVLLAACVLVVLAAIGVILNRSQGSGDNKAQAQTEDEDRDPGSKIPATTWGTNETILVASLGKTVIPGTGHAPGGDTVPDKGKPEDADTTPQTNGDTTPQTTGDQSQDTGDTGDTNPDATKPEQALDKVPDKTPDTDKKVTKPDTGKKTVKKTTKSDPPATNTAAASKTAAGQYQSKEFGKAADTLRDAAKGASAKQAKSLRETAATYEKIGSLISKGNSDQSRDPTAALSAYDQAYRLDKQVGGAHASFLRSKLGVVAPRAAASHMANGKYEAAKSAADKATSYGAGGDSMVKRVRSGLESKAAEFYKEALRIKAKDKAGAKKLLQRIMDIVPSSSPSYGKAAKLIGKL